MRAVLRCTVLAAAALIVPVLATPASAGPELGIVYVYNGENGVGAGANIGTGHIAGATVYYSGAACVSIGMADRICTNG